jgi:hypothetical protein
MCVSSAEDIPATKEKSVSATAACAILDQAGSGRSGVYADCFQIVGIQLRVLGALLSPKNTRALAEGIQRTQVEGYLSGLDSF